MNNRYTNYALERTPLLVDVGRLQNSNLEIKLKLTSDSSAWRCLGTSESRLDTYGCDVPLQEALRSVNNNFGLIIMPVESNPNLDLQPSGEIRINSIRILSPGFF